MNTANNLTPNLPAFGFDDVLLTPCFVSVLLHDRRFGGHEEGGWWYDTTERLESHYAANLTALSAIMARITAQYSNEGRRPIHSVACDGLYLVEIGTQPAPLYEPETRPHYE